ncbi:putative transesterase [Cercophora scortea]|uniref:Transesterase n=1 Tax=Cercophora scortea TaxID=314031 RepID=A0AAE0J1V2_9PEZI|nr:putative transesterase [Cercophora scortea]
MNANDIETAVQTAIDAGKIGGAIICAANTDGTFIFNKALGSRTLLSGEKVPHQLSDVLYLASATKLIATIAALQCVEDGLLTLTSDLSPIVPSLAAKQVLTGWDSTSDPLTPILTPVTRPITLEMLLTHSSGLSYDFLTPPIAAWTKAFDHPAPGTTRPVEEAFSYPLGFQPGTSWMYGPGLDFAGLVVERLTKGTLSQHVQKRICAPLGITTAHFFPVTREDLRARMVDLNPSDPDGLGRAVLGGGEMNARSKGDFGGHGLFMSGEDYVKVLRSLLANDGKILRPETVDSMFENHLAPEAAEGHKAALASKGGMFFRVGITEGSKAGHGLGGLLTLEDVEGWYGERTLTWGGGMSLSWFIDRKNGLCGIGAMQPTLPIDVMAIEGLKQVFRQDMYRQYAAWKEGKRE